MRKEKFIVLINSASILLFRLIGYLFIALVPLTILIVGFVVLLEQDEAAIKISNIGFLMFIAMANSCFSWSRSLESDNRERSKVVAQMSVEYIIAAILFLFASLSKFALTLEIVLFSDQYVEFVLNGIAMVCFFMVFVIFILSTYQFFTIYYSTYIGIQDEE